MTTYLALHKISLKNIKIVFNRKKNPDDFRLTEEHGLIALSINEKVFHIFPPVDIFIVYLYNIT